MTDQKNKTLGPIARALPTPLRSLQEPINTLSHALGFLLAAAGLAWLLELSDGDPRKIFAFTVYMVTMMIQYAMSTALHGLRLSRWKMRQLTRLDHAAIFLFIAGAFTPVCVLANDHTAGMIAVAAIWALALAGVCLKLFWLDAPRWASTIAFQVVVVVSYFIVYPFLAEIPGQGAYWLALGGKFYLAGSLFYAFRRPNILPGIFGHHELLHFFVLAGSACHYMVMVGYAS